ncbi:DUF1622 domain-containing protein [Dethiobacter alkaliphilus]|uniref:DUF1622 domain-containing protein n=1 Tax=Dethiobacter alkaliphilus AHT 1 TaxID=555088 RepID=C0GHE0_DETAL|nr:DUF1622 domain-containing protein [Dethiobacter alkaliphilus]EEG77146.1 protein of unknown function DUF1622 [Dethiobacter alkaliphilus AHT 1]
MDFIHLMEEMLTDVTLVLVHMLEIFGAIIILYAGTGTFLRFLQKSKDGREARLDFARYLVFGLEFKLAGEILRTMVVRTFNEIAILGAVILLRAALNFIIHWEIRQEQQEHD